MPMLELQKPPLRPSPLRPLLYQLRVQTLIWSVSLTLMLADDAAMLAMLFY